MINKFLVLGWLIILPSLFGQIITYPPGSSGGSGGNPTNNITFQKVDIGQFETNNSLLKIQAGVTNAVGTNVTFILADNSPTEFQTTNSANQTITISGLPSLTNRDKIWFVRVFQPSTNTITWGGTVPTLGTGEIFENPPPAGLNEYLLNVVNGTLYYHPLRPLSYVNVSSVSTIPSTPTSGLKVFTTVTNKFVWIGTNGFLREFDGTANTANRSYALPDKSGTVALLSDVTNTIYTLEGHAINTATISDGSVYYMGIFSDVALSTSTNLAAMTIPRAGTVVKFAVRVYVSGTLGSSENVTCELRRNTGAALTDFGSTTMTWDAINTQCVSGTLSQAVSEGDTLIFKITAPTFATNPTNVRAWGVICIQL